jgi:holo-[acyl-carrier protein] synthase
VSGLRVGIDLVRVARITESLARFGERFTRRVFTDSEIAYCDDTTAPETRASRYAARFAAKEAAWKALGLLDRGHAWTAIEIVRETSGACAVVLHEPLRSSAANDGVRPLSVSITHEDDYAAAVVLAVAG